MFSLKYLETLSDKTGYNVRVLEKQIVLLNLLNEFSGHPRISRVYALKGGTALNIFWFNFPRLSVDLDFNYIGSPDRAVMLEQRDMLENQIRRVTEAAGIRVDHIAKYHAGGKWRLRSPSALGGNMSVELDLNYLMRVPVWEPTFRESAVLDEEFKTKCLCIDIHELFAGKIKALLERSAARDLFDVYMLASGSGTVDTEKLRKNVILFGITSNVDWRNIDYRTINAISAERFNIELEELVIEDLNFEKMKKTVKSYLDTLFQYNADEVTFLNKFLDDGVFEPQLLFRDAEKADKIRQHPAVLWKLKNLREYKGLKG